MMILKSLYHVSIKEKKGEKKPHAVSPNRPIFEIYHLTQQTTQFLGKLLELNSDAFVGRLNKRTHRQSPSSINSLLHRG